MGPKGLPDSNQKLHCSFDAPEIRWEDFGNVLKNGQSLLYITPPQQDAGTDPLVGCSHARPTHSKV